MMKSLTLYLTNLFVPLWFRFNKNLLRDLGKIPSVLGILLLQSTRFYDYI